MSQIIQYFSEAGTGTVLSVTGGHDINISGTPTVNPIVNLDNTILLGDLSVVLAGNPSLTLTSGDLTISGTGIGAGGNLNLPTTTSANVGVITVNGDPWIHNYGGDNIFIGHSAGNFAIVTGDFNIGIGQSTFQDLTTGDQNIAIGVGVMDHLTTSIGNVGVGHQALNQVDQAGAGAANFNTAVGWEAGFNLEDGTANTLIGVSAGEGLVGTGSYNTVVGAFSGSDYIGGESSNIAISHNGVAGDSHIIRIGTQGSGNLQQNRCFIAGIDGVNVGSVATVVTESGTQLGTAVITAGTNISVTPGANTITIASTGSASFAWSVETANLNMVVNHGYICNKASALVLTLPTTSVVGSIIEVTGINTALGWQVAQNASQIIHFGTSNTTTGVAGSLASTAIRDSIKMVCVVADLEWNVLSSIGNITVT